MAEGRGGGGGGSIDDMRGKCGTPDGTSKPCITGWEDS